MEIHLVTIFPSIFDSYLQESMMARAQKSGAVKFVIHDLRKFSRSKHKKVDDRPYGGGPGMVMQADPIVRAIRSIVKKKNATTKIVLTSAKGKLFTQQVARTVSKKIKKLVIICGHYEGVDERVMKYVDAEWSIGPYVLTGGELPALVIVDALTRLLPNVLGDEKSHVDESHEVKGVLEYPQYTRPPRFEGKSVPSILLSGDHSKILKWRNAHKKKS